MLRASTRHNRWPIIHSNDAERRIGRRRRRVDLVSPGRFCRLRGASCAGAPVCHLENSRLTDSPDLLPMDIVWGRQFGCHGFVPLPVTRTNAPHNASLVTNRPEFREICLVMVFYKPNARCVVVED